MMSEMTVNIPPVFYEVNYRSEIIPGIENPSDLALGANCQLFAYQLLRINGLNPNDDRSSELWNDTAYSRVVITFRPLDLMLYSESGVPYGAHVGVYLGEGKIIHLSKENGTPHITEHTDMLKNPRYSKFIGAKRVFKCSYPSKTTKGIEANYQSTDQ